MNDRDKGEGDYELSSPTNKLKEIAKDGSSGTQSKQLSPSSFNTAIAITLLIASLLGGVLSWWTERKAFETEQEKRVATEHELKKLRDRDARIRTKLAKDYWWYTSDVLKLMDEESDPSSKVNK